MYQGKYWTESSSYVCGLKRSLGEDADTTLRYEWDKPTVYRSAVRSNSLWNTVAVPIQLLLSPFQNNSFKCCILQSSLSSIRSSSNLRTSFRRLLTAERSEIESNAGAWQMEIATHTYTTKPLTAGQKTYVKFTNRITLHGDSSGKASTWGVYRVSARSLSNRRI